MNHIQSKIYRFINFKHHIFNQANLPHIQIDTLVHHLAEKLCDLLIKAPTDNISSIPIHTANASVLLSTLIDGDIEQQKHLDDCSRYCATVFIKLTDNKLKYDQFFAKPETNKTINVTIKASR
jgi:hypothetical protein